MNRLKVLLTTILLLFPLTACGMDEKETSSPLVGQSFALTSPLFILTDLTKNPSLTESVTAVRLGKFAVETENLVNCSGCNLKVLSLDKLLPVGSKVTVKKSFATVPPAIHIGGSGVEYFIMETSDGSQFTTAAHSLDNAIHDYDVNRDAETLERLLNSFTNDRETKSFYFQTKQFYQESVFPGKQPPFTSDDVTSTFKEVFADIGNYNITNINTNTGQLAFSATTDRQGLAYLILKTSEKYVSLSPLTTVPLTSAP